MADDFTLALERADDDAFTTGTYARTFVVLGATPVPVYPQGSRKKWGWRVENSTVYWFEIAVQLDLVSIEDYGNIVDLAYILGSEHCRILAAGTELPRMYSAGVEFWTDPTVGYVRDNLPIAREEFTVSPDFGSGGDTVSLRLRPLDPAAKPTISEDP